MVRIGKNLIQELVEDGFFSDWRTMNEILKKLSSRGFTVSGKKIGRLAQTLTQMCRDRGTGLERDELPDSELAVAGGKWRYKKVR